jgi:hypothetical protein
MLFCPRSLIWLRYFHPLSHAVSPCILQQALHPAPVARSFASSSRSRLKSSSSSPRSSSQSIIHLNRVISVSSARTTASQERAIAENDLGDSESGAIVQQPAIHLRNIARLLQLLCYILLIRDFTAVYNNDYEWWMSRFMFVCVGVAGGAQRILK